MIPVSTYTKNGPGKGLSRKETPVFIRLDFGESVLLLKLTGKKEKSKPGKIW